MACYVELVQQIGWIGSASSVESMMVSSKGDVASFPLTERHILWLKTDVVESRDVPTIIFFAMSHKSTMSDNSNGVPPLPPPPPQPPGRANGGRRPGAGDCSWEEQLHFLGVVEQISQIGPGEWDQVQQEHKAEIPGRDVNSIRRRCNRLHRKKIPTGDPTMPPEARQAVHAKCKIGDKSNVGQGDKNLMERLRRVERQGEGEDGEEGGD